MSPDPLPTDLAAAHAMILAQREELTLAKSEVTVCRLEIERLKLMLAKARREQFGQSSERSRRDRGDLRAQSPPYCALMRRCRGAGGRNVIEMRRAQLSFGDGLIAGEVSDPREGWMTHADRFSRMNRS